jgi:NAD(P)H dehydrogenase (quinone)
MKQFLKYTAYVIVILLFQLFSFSLHAQSTILIVYHSETGNTERLAETVAEGASQVEGVDVVLKTSNQIKMQDLLNADAIIVGSPVYNANVSPEISRFIASWPFEGEPLKDKIGAAFVTAGGISAGEEIVQMNILQSMLIFGMIVVGGPDWTQPFGASAIVGEPPFVAESHDEIDEEFLKKGRALGKRVAEVALQMKRE